MPQLIGMHRVVGCSKLNTGLFEKLSAAPNVRAAFCGHDHTNDFVVKRGDVFMCYGRTSSFSPPSDWEGDSGGLPFERGTRAVCLDWSEGILKLQTWIEEETGKDEKSFIDLM